MSISERLCGNYSKRGKVVEKNSALNIYLKYTGIVPFSGGKLCNVLSSWWVVCFPRLWYGKIQTSLFKFLGFSCKPP